MNLYTLVFQQQNRYKFLNWDELFYYTKLTPSQIKQVVNNKEYQLNDPLSTLVYSHKNHNLNALDNIFDNYNNPSNFELNYNDYGLSTNFILQAKNPTWQNYNSNTDWYWKQNWIYKYGQWLLIFPGISTIFLTCSAALENSHDGSDIDLMIQVQKNFVWITKAYFAVFSKILKYYDLNFSLAFFYYITRQIDKLEDLKHKNTINKIKIDFGLVFEDYKDLEKYYSNKERNLFIWSALNVDSNSKYQKLNFTPNSIQTKQILNPILFKSIKTLLYLTIFLILPFGLLNYLFEQKNSNDYNKLVLWNIYSQYNLIY